MGTWAEGNFDNDAARDVIANFVKEIEEEMQPPRDFVDIDLVMAAVEARMALIQLCHAHKPERSEVERLMSAVLSVYDSEIDEYDPKDGFKEKRRQVIESTFERFRELSQ